jgi:Exonuclease VII, large subunit
VRLGGRLEHILSLYESQVEALRRGMPPLKVWLEDQGQKLDEYYERLVQAGKRLFDQQIVSLTHCTQRLVPAIGVILRTKSHQFETLAQLLESYSYTRTLMRGFAFVTALDQSLVSSKKEVTAKQILQIHFQDGVVAAEALEEEERNPSLQLFPEM